MPLYTKESLDLLRQRIDLSEVISAHIDLKKAGSAYKALCPFHEEKSPSFIVNRGDNHYHCFGCGAHGDAIAFLMNHLKMGFTEAVESLAEKFGVVLERDDKVENTGPSKTLLKEAMQLACRFYHFMLLHTEEGVPALQYLYKRGIDLDFIQRFEIGFAPRQRNALYKILKTKELSDPVLQGAGLLSISEDGTKRDFFSDRIMFPIRDGMGNVIGFSGRKFKEETFGGKYINTSETPLFKKSLVLFGLSYSRKTITKEKKAMVVEGQIDCLRLIQEGFDYTIAGQGTAFGEGHVRELLNLGVQTVYLALDGDTAGEEAAVKIGDLFQKKGVEVWVVPLPAKQDPDTLLRERGAAWFAEHLQKPTDYLTFLVGKLSKTHSLDSPSGKNALTESVVERVRAWEHPVMVHESLRKLALLVQVPEELIGVGSLQTTVVKREGKLQGQEGVDADKILETDLLRILFLAGEGMQKLFVIAKANLLPGHLRVPVCQRLYAIFMEAYEKGDSTDLLSCAAGLEKEDESDIVLDIMGRKIQVEKAEESLLNTIKRILQRNWMEERETIKQKIHSGRLEEEEALELAKQFDVLKRLVPEVIIPA
jgi:DNA primase